MAEKKKPDEEIIEKPEKVDVTAFKHRKLKALNEMKNQAKARFLAERVINN